MNLVIVEKNKMKGNLGPDHLAGGKCVATLLSQLVSSFVEEPENIRDTVKMQPLRASQPIMAQSHQCNVISYGCLITVIW